METTITNKKSGLLKLTKVLLIGALMSFGLKANAQCAASYTYTVSPANDGVVSFTNTSIIGSGPSYIWNFGDGTNSYATSPTHTFSYTGTYMVNLQIFDSLSSCYDSISYPITVTNSTGTACNASFTPYDSLGYGYFYNTSVGTGVNSTWTFGDGTSGSSSGTSGTTHLYAGPGTYNVCLTISNFMATCSDTYCTTVTIGSSSSGSCLGYVNSNFTAADSASSYGVFHNTPTGPGQTYFWDFGDGTTGTTVGNTTHLYPAIGTYPVCLTVYQGGATADSCQFCSYVTIHGSGVSGICDATFSVNQDTINLYNYFVYHTHISSSSASYFWDYGDGTTSNLEYPPTHTYADTVSYYLCLTVTDTMPMIACTATYCDTIAAGRSTTGISVTVVNPTSTGIAEMNATSSLENYPNPFSASTTIKYAISKDAAVQIYVIDLLGNKVATLESSNISAGDHSTVWNAEGVAEGMYLLQMHVNNQITTKKIVISK